MRPIATVFLTEWRQRLARLAISAVLLAAADVYIASQAGRWANFSDIPAGATTLLFLMLLSPVFAAPLFAVDTLRSEWGNHTEHLWLSLPVPGRTVLGGTMLAIFAQSALLAIISWGVLWWLFAKTVIPPEPLPSLAETVAGLAFVSLFSILLGGIGLLAFLAVKAVGRLRRLITILSVLGTWYVVVKLIPTLMAAARPIGTYWLIVMELLGIAAILSLAAVLWDRKVEV